MKETDMILEEFARRSREITGSEALSVRDQYRDAFLWTRSPHFLQRIAAHLERGNTYPGFMWDALIGATRVAEDELWEFINEMGSVYVLWDLHADEGPRLDTVWPFERDSVVQCSVADLLAVRASLPEDLYLFDDSYEWTRVLTDEWVQWEDVDIPMVRWCLAAPWVERWVVEVASKVSSETDEHMRIEILPTEAQARAAVADYSSDQAKATYHSGRYYPNGHP